MSAASGQPRQPREKIPVEYITTMQAGYMGTAQQVHVHLGAPEAVAARPDGAVERLLAFGGVWAFCLFLLQALAEFTGTLPLSLANVAYALAAALAVTAAGLAWHHRASARH